MEILSILKAVLTPEKDRTEDSFAFLKPGDKLVGKVLRLEADGRVLIDLGRVRALAQTTVPVQVGQQLPLKVIRTGQPVQLRLDVAPNKTSQPPGPQMALPALFSSEDQQLIKHVIDRLLSHSMDAGQTAKPTQTSMAQETIGHGRLSSDGLQAIERNLFAKGGIPEPARQALLHLKSVFEPLVMDRPAAQQTQWVQSAVEDNGILFELKLADTLGQSPPASTKQMPLAQPMPPLSTKNSPVTELSQALKLGSDFQHIKTVPDASTIVGKHAETGNAHSGQATGHASNEATTANALHILARDLKPQLLILKFYFNALDGPTAETMDTKDNDTAFLRQAVDKILSHVEAQQQQAVRRSGEPEAYQVFTHQLPVKDQSMPVQLKVYYPKKGGPARDDPQHRIALLLDMDHLGQVRADLSMAERQLRIQFYVRDESIQKLFAPHMQTVAQALEGAFDQVHIDTQVSKEKIARFEGEDLLGPPLGRINLKA